MTAWSDKIDARLKGLSEDLADLRRLNTRTGIVKRDEMTLRREIARAGRQTIAVPALLFDDVGSAAAAQTAAAAYTNTAVAGIVQGTRNLSAQFTIVTSQANTNENDLMTYTIAAGKMATNGDVVTCRMVFFTNAAVPATRDIRAYYNGQVIYDSTAVAGLTSTTLVLDIEIMRVTSTAQKIVVIADGDFTVLSSVPTRTAGTGTMANALILKATSQQGAGAGAADVTQASMNTLYTPVAA